MKGYLETVRIPVLVFALALSVSAIAGLHALLSALAAGVAIMLPELYYLAHLHRLRRRRPLAALPSAVRARVWRLSSVTVFLAIGVQALGGDLVIWAWLATILAMVAADIAAVWQMQVSYEAGKEEGKSGRQD